MSTSQAPSQVGEPFPLSTLRHSVSHLMASAVQRLYPGVSFGFGPSIEHGFYYDFDLPVKLEEADLAAIEKEMRRIAKQTPQLTCETVPREEARQRLAAKHQDYKIEALDSFPADATITFYRHGDWEDLCEGPHVDRLDRNFHFKLLSLAGAYWRGDEKRPMLQRIYGTAFWSKEELDKHLAWLAEIKERDHRKLGTDLDLFSTHPDAGAGFVFWHPNLGAVRRAIETFWWEEHQRRGYEAVYTPHVLREQIFAISGHLQNYAEMMYAPMELDEMPYRVKPMNCPGHLIIYGTRNHSYRDLPLRWAELGTVYRFEKSGVLHGMLRVRGFTQDDAHIFCTPEQLEEEIAGVVELIRMMLTTFGFEYTAYLATRPEKAIGSEEIWAKATAALESAAKRENLPLVLDEGGGAFYGPKIDFKVRDALGREWQNSTVQCDFNLPERFDIKFTDSDGVQKRPIMIHRAVLGSMERFVGGLIEHFGGKFPLWCAPHQVALIPIREEHADYVRGLAKRLQQNLYRVDCMDDPGHMNKKIKEAQHAQIPFMLIAGDREAAEGTVAVRRRGTREQLDMKFDDFVALIERLRTTRSLGLE
ncbi:MAG TPA: threonine--tRNA ligase [Planctomycetota bacterium]|nr:threonine--tRNA ligase [Planctomycetota bacterium]